MTGDHGEELFDHGSHGHTADVFWNERVNVPLLMCLPNRPSVYEARTVSDMLAMAEQAPVSSHVDLLPTVLSAISTGDLHSRTVSQLRDCTHGEALPYFLNNSNSSKANSTRQYMRIDVCRHVYGYVHVCIDMYRHVQTCADMCRHAHIACMWTYLYTCTCRGNTVGMSMHKSLRMTVQVCRHRLVFGRGERLVLLDAGLKAALSTECTEPRDACLRPSAVGGWLSNLRHRRNDEVLQVGTAYDRREITGRFDRYRDAALDLMPKVCDVFKFGGQMSAGYQTKATSLAAAVLWLLRDVGGLSSEALKCAAKACNECEALKGLPLLLRCMHRAAMQLCKSRVASKLRPILTEILAPVTVQKQPGITASQVAEFSTE